MFVVDTNVISETMRAEPHVSVITWLDARPARDLFVTAVTEAEIRTGVAMLPEGRRRRNLAEAAERVFGKMFAGRVLPFDGAAAARLCENCLCTPAGRAADFPSRWPDRSDCLCTQYGSGDP